MSKISQELKVLLFLNQRYSRTKWVTINEIADYLDVSDRQARRYLEDLNTITDIDVETKLGRNGGYRLKTPLDKGFAMPENIVLALSIAMKRNEKIESVLSTLPNYVITSAISGDNQITNEVLDNLEIIVKAIENQKQLSFKYNKGSSLYLVDPYKIVITNHTYYLIARHNDETKSLNVSLLEELKQLGSFKVESKVLEEIKNKTSHFGVGTKNDKEATLRVKCENKDTLLIFDKYFEGKGVMDLDLLTYTVIGNSKHELYYPLFRISTKSYEFLDEEFKNDYIDYLRKQIISIERETK